jgi:protein-L-isoaspartate(D-aspartate) O-methyltransferase
MQYMLDAIRDDAQATEGYTGQATIDDRVMDAIAKTRREKFVPKGSEHLAYYNRPLPIGHNQTISQPFIVALMTDLLEPKPTDRVLEIGTGSGYQAAILAELVDEVYTIEIVEALAEEADARLDDLGYDNVHVRSGDGWHGWPEHAPFDSIIVTAVADDIPPKLLEQLKVGGRIVMPIKRNLDFEQLIVVTKEGDAVSTRDVLPVRFVPLTRK